MLSEKHILVVDDDERLSHLLKSYLFKKGYLVDSAINTKIARDKMASILYDMIILDVMLPEESGLKFASILRKGNSIPILMLSAMGETEDRIKGLKTGVDEYLPKPFEPEELLLRIQNVLKRGAVKDKEANSIELGDIIFKTDDRLLIYAKNSVKLTVNESRLIMYLHKNIPNPVNRQSLAELLSVSSRTIDVIIKRLRFKIKIFPNHQNFILTIRGVGYRMEV